MLITRSTAVPPPHHDAIKVIDSSQGGNEREAKKKASLLSLFLFHIPIDTKPKVYIVRNIIEMVGTQHISVIFFFADTYK